MSTTVDEFTLLIEQTRAGSDDAAHALLNKYQNHVLRVVRRKMNRTLRVKFDSQDIMQAVWASFFENRQEISKFERPEALVAFLVTVAGNKVVDECRRYFQTEKHNVNREHSLDSVSAAGADVPQGRQATPSETVAAKEQWEGMLRDQPSHYRQMLHLRGGGATFTDIAEELGVDEKTVRRVIKRITERQTP